MSSPVPVKVRLLREGARAPSYQTPGSSGADLHALPGMKVVLAPGERRAIPLGIALEIPPGWEGQVRPRSGLALRHGIGMVNSPGTIDADYRGEIMVILINLGIEPFVVQDGDRIAQLVVTPAPQIEYVLVGHLDPTGRGDGGFGSTGI